VDKPYPIRTALVSVFDKAGLEPLAKALVQKGVKLYSTGGTATALEKLGLAVTKIEAVTEFPEMMDGRVKTLHPRVFGGILARRDFAEDLTAAQTHGIPLFDLVAVNLYPFWDHKGKPLADQIKFIDIGGPSMIRAAAKNHAAVTVLSHPSDYAEFLQELEAQNGATTLDFRFRMAARTFQRTAEYDQSIAAEWSKSALPTGLSLSPQTPLRYGENPHQAAAWSGPTPPPWKTLQGKELSYNNLLDTEAALRIIEEFSLPAVAIIKHNNPCGAAVLDRPLLEVYQSALACDSKSAFGGIIATNKTIDRETAAAMAELFLEVVLAPAFSPEAVEIFSKKKNLRLIEWAKPVSAAFEVRSALGGWLVQEADQKPGGEWKSVTKVTAPRETEHDLRFAWGICKHVRSNAIVIARDGATVGIGAGQMSRVDAVNIALQKSDSSKLSGAVLASDAFFPFRDNIDLLKGKGIRAIIQPGGSQRDPEVIQACDELGIAMVFTGQRHFRH